MGTLQGSSEAFDPETDEVVLFGGINVSAGALSGSTWLYRSGGWALLCSACGPAPRAWASMTYDATDGYVLLFGGFDGSPLGDAWAFESGTWKEICAACSPPARSAASMSYDAAAGEVVLFGGCGATCPLGDAWSFRAGAWSEICSSSCGPPARANASMAYDPVDGYLVLFGGSDGTTDLTDAWNFSTGSAWTSLCRPCSPPARSGAALAFDTADGFLLLFGGYNASTSTYQDDSWEFLAGTFTQLALTSAPSARSDAGLAEDPENGGLLLYGGFDGSPLEDTWSFLYGLSAGPPTPAPAAIDSGETTAITSTVSGGTSPFSYTWEGGLPLGCTSADSDPWSCTPSGIAANTTYSLWVEVADANGVRVLSPVLNLTVRSDPKTGPLAASPASGAADANQTIVFSVPTSGGAGNYSYLWSGLPPNCTATSYRVVRCVPWGIATNTTYDVSVSVVDANGGTSSEGPQAYTVDSDASVRAPTISMVSVEVGTPITLGSNARNGSGDYSWSWANLPPGCSSVDAPSFSCTPSGLVGNATYQVRASVVDSNGRKETSAPTPLSVIGGPTLGGPTSSRPVIDLGESVYFNATPAGGVGGYSFHWWGLPPGCSSQNVPHLFCAPTGPADNASYRIYANATDAGGQTATSGFLFFSVDADPTISSITATRTSLDAGEETKLSVVVSGGAGAYSFRWGGLPPGCAPENAPVLSCVPSTALAKNSTYEVSVNSTDAAGVTLGTHELQLHVDTFPRVSVVWAAPTGVDEGQTVALSVNVSGGAGAYRFVWWGLPNGCQGSDAPSLLCVPMGQATNATYALGVSVEDANGLTVTGPSLNLTVDATPQSSPPEAPYPEVDVGENFLLTTHPTGGSGSYLFSWSPLPPGCLADNLSYVLCSPRLPGNFAIGVVVADTRGAISPLVENSLMVVADPTVASFYASDDSIAVGASISFTVVATGGVGPYTFNYTGLPSGCSSVDSPHLTCTAYAAGDYSTLVTLTDARGVQAAKSLGWHVMAEPAAQGLFGLPSVQGYVVLGALVATFALVLFLVLPRLWRHRESGLEVEGAGSEETESVIEVPSPRAATEGPNKELRGHRGPESEAPQESHEAVDAPHPQGGEATPVSFEPAGMVGLPELSGDLLPPPPPPEARPPTNPPPPSSSATGLEPSPPNVEPSSGAAPARPTSPEGSTPTVRKCPLCGSVLSDRNVCRSCQLDWSAVQIQGRTDTLRPKRPPH